MRRPARHRIRLTPEQWLGRRRWRNGAIGCVAVIVAAMVVWQWLKPSPATVAGGRRWIVTQVADDLTLELRRMDEAAAQQGEGETLAVALWGVKVREGKAAAAKQWLMEQTAGRVVRVEIDPRAGGSATAGVLRGYCYAGDVMLNEAGLRAGLWVVDDRTVHRLEVWFRKLQRGAEVAASKGP
jgi:hypothetical protein